MRRLSGGQLGIVFGLSCALLCACASNSDGDPHGASGAATATAGAAAQGGTSANGGASSGGAQVGESGDSGDSGNAGDAGSSGGSASAGDTGSAGDSSSSAGSGGAQNIFLAQVVLETGGGPPHCLPRSLPSGLPGSADDGQANCLIAELKPGSCDCTQTARAPLRVAILTATKQQLQANQACGGTSGVSCDSFCGCEIVQAPGIASDQGSELYACQNEPTPASSVNGFCLIDQMRTDESGADSPLGSAALVSECPTNQKRRLRFVGAGLPSSGATTFLGCPAH